MKRSELVEILRQEYQRGRSCGVAKVKDPDFRNIWFVVPPPPPKERPTRLPAALLARTHQLLERLPREDEVKEIDRMASYLFLHREAVQSSRMEGTWSTVDHILTPGEMYDAGEGDSARASVLGYAQALGKVINRCHKRGARIFTSEVVCELHRQVVCRDPNFSGKPGQLRKPGTPNSIVFIGGLHRKEESIYNPTPPHFVDHCLTEVMKWFANEEIIELGEAGMGMSLPIRMAIGHAHFEAVHPFSDGNGRVGRMLLALQMVCHGIMPLYLSGFIEAEREGYSKALQQAQKKLNYGPIVAFICEAICASHEEAEAITEQIRKLPEQWSKRGVFRENSTAKRSLSGLIHRPLFTVKNLQEHLNVSAPAANRAVHQLIQKKIVRERTGYGRNRLFAAEEVIALLAKKFGEKPKWALKRAQVLLTKM